MKIGIANDHHGVLVKQELTKFLTSKGYNVINYGTDSDENIDYCDFAFKVGEEVINKNIDYGILLCNTGIGMSIACNKVKKIRCAKVSNVYEAQMTRRDNDANVIALSAREDIEKLKEIVNVFLNTPYANIERYNRRKDKIDNYDS
jgi:ribose 5-phosphate isomerase B